MWEHFTCGDWLYIAYACRLTVLASAVHESHQFHTWTKQGSQGSNNFVELFLRELNKVVNQDHMVGVGWTSWWINRSKIYALQGIKSWVKSQPWPIVGLRPSFWRADCHGQTNVTWNVVHFCTWYGTSPCTWCEWGRFSQNDFLQKNFKWHTT